MNVNITIPQCPVTDRALREKSLLFLDTGRAALAGRRTVLFHGFRLGIERIGRFHHALTLRGARFLPRLSRRLSFGVSGLAGRARIGRRRRRCANPAARLTREIASGSACGGWAACELRNKASTIRNRASRT